MRWLVANVSFWSQHAEPLQTVVAGGGMGRPVVVNPSAGQGLGECKHCGAALEGEGTFCSQCGKRQ